MINTDIIKLHLQDYVEQITTRDKLAGKYKYVCPLCGSGKQEGRKHDGAFSLYDKQGGYFTRWKCFACDRGGDIFNLIEEVEGITDFKEQVERAKRLLDPVELEQLGDTEEGYKALPSTSPKQDKARSTGKPEREAEPVEAPAVLKKGLFKDFLFKCHEAVLEDASPNAGKQYLESRGFTQETIDKFKLGYDANRNAITIPHDGALSYYAIRYIDPVNGQRYDNPRNIEGTLFNEGALLATGKKGKREIIFVVEGQLDAISIMQYSAQYPAYWMKKKDKPYQAIAHTNKKSRLINILKYLKGQGRLLPDLAIIPDNDEVGRQKAEELAKALDEIGVLNYVYDFKQLCDGVKEKFNADIKDINDILKDDQIDIAFISPVLDSCHGQLTKARQELERQEQEAREAEERARKEREEAELKEKLRAVNSHNVFTLIDPFIEEVKSGHNATIKTGFDELDKAIGGESNKGLYSGLYIIGAISSLGKTSYCLQLADQLASNGNDVLFFSLEMSQYELMAKSLSRWTYILYEKNPNKYMNSESHCKTQRDILSGRQYLDAKETGFSGFNRYEKELYADALEEYKEQAKHLYIYEGIGDISVFNIREAVEQHIQATGNTPIVFVDYLQILAPYTNEYIRATDKQNTDKSVLELKKLSRDYNSVVIAISSLNRESYNQHMSMTAFKESGAVEYGSDVLLGLQPQAMARNTVEAKAFDMERNEKQKSNIALDAYNTNNISECKLASERAIEIVVLKNRSGRTGEKVGYIYKPMYNHFEEDESYIPYEIKCSGIIEKISSK